MAKRPGGVRDREKTQAKILAAVGQVLAKQGFTKIGINAIAREAGVDKVLIYRYFGGLPELMRAYAQEGDFWPSLEELVGGDPMKLDKLDAKDILSEIMKNYLFAIKNRPLTQEILAWETLERNELTIELETIREQTTLKLFARYGHLIPPDKDVQAITALLSAAINYLVIRSRDIRWFGGIDLQADKDWKRLETSMTRMISNTLT